MKEVMTIFFEKKDIRVLVVDDNQSLADILVDYLSSRGFSATPAYSGIPNKTGNHLST